MFWQHLAMQPLQSSVTLALSGPHILANIPPHVLRHPKMSGLQSSIRRTAETINLVGQLIHLMLFNISNTHQQS
jgi:hypothetical protein